MCANASGLSSVIVYRYFTISKVPFNLGAVLDRYTASLVEMMLKKPKAKQTNKQKQNFAATREIPGGPGQSKVRRRVQREMLSFYK